MIILRHVTVEDFRLLRRVELHFPQCGSILIAGPNDAGKSALLESMYFALYGEPLVSVVGGSRAELSGAGTSAVGTMMADQSALGTIRSLQPADPKGRREAALQAGFQESPNRPLRRDSSLDELVRYGERRARVTLTLSIGVTDVTIRRTIERGKGQSVVLSVRRLGMPEEEPITEVGEANERIIAELGGMDGEALRSSCLIEQKGVDRLEHVGAGEREATVRKLLGLEQLVRVGAQFTLTEQDSELLKECRLLLSLAEVQARLPELSMQLGQIEMALDAVSVTEELAEIEQQEAEIAEQVVSLEQIALRRHEFKGRKMRIGQLRKAETLLGELIGAYDAIAEASRELPELERQITELGRRERDELPALESRVHELSELTRSFGTLERLAADLLAAVHTIKALEQDLKEQADLEGDLADLDEQVMAAYVQVEQARQSQYEVEEGDRASRPQLEARLGRLGALAARVKELLEAEERYSQNVLQQGWEEENSAELEKVQREVQETEAELALVEQEAQQRELEAETHERYWREVSIGRQLQEWRRVKVRAQGLAEAEQQVMAAHERQEQLTLIALAARRGVTTSMGSAIACVTLFLVCGGLALFLALHSASVYAAMAVLAALLLLAGAGLSLQHYRRSREEERVADAQMQDAISRVGVMVAAREAASRAANGVAEGGMGASARSYDDALGVIEHELRSLGGPVPRSLEEAESLLADKSAVGTMNWPLREGADDQSAVGAVQESLADMQQRMIESKNNALAARNQVNVTMEATARLRKERTRLEEQRKEKGWDTLAERLRSDAEAIEQMRHDIASSAGEEGLPIPHFEFASVGASIERSGAQILRSAQDDTIREAVTVSGVKDDNALAQFKSQLEDAIGSTEREIAVLDRKLALLPELRAQVEAYQALLDARLTHKQAILERSERFSASNTQQQIENARQQQVALRDALRSLQDSLRERVQKLGVSFGQAAISAAEHAARQQLESLQILLGQRVELERRHAAYAALLQERQETLSEHYAHLAKLSGSLGSWVVPPSPFAEELAAVRARCQQEAQEANEEATLHELEMLDMQEGASQAKIALCHAEIEAAHERIATRLAQRNRPPAKGYRLSDIVAVWPLVGKYTPQDREPLQMEAAAIEQQLHELEEQERTLSVTDESAVGAINRPLQRGTGRVDLEEARRRLEQQERVYETKKRASLLVQAVEDRVMRKMLPRTEYYIQQLLPPLTHGRFHDARLTSVPHPSDGAWQVHVWEPQAFDYIPRSALSGGTADLLSLALRLAFAIAVLPRELGAAPGFLLLDEPLGATDSERARALVELVTGQILSSHFEQIVLVSHIGMWNPGLFAYHVSIDDGEVVESNLPVTTLQPHTAYVHATR